MGQSGDGLGLYLGADFDRNVTRDVQTHSCHKQMPIDLNISSESDYRTSNEPFVGVGLLERGRIVHEEVHGRMPMVLEQNH